MAPDKWGIGDMEDAEGTDPAAAPGGPRWLTLKEAAALLDCSVSTLRKWRRNGEIRWRMGRGPHGRQVEVESSSLLERARETLPQVPDRLDPAWLDGIRRLEGATAGVSGLGQALTIIRELALELAAARERAARAEAQLAALEGHRHGSSREAIR